MFILWHILAIASVIIISFIAGILFNKHYHPKQIKQHKVNKQWYSKISLFE
jgi:hypothetical protein